MSELDDPAAAPTRAFDLQSGACIAFGSPFAGALLALAGREVGAGRALDDLLQPWAGLGTRALMGEAVPLRWLGCVHDLALSGEADDLSRAFPAPDRPGDAEAAFAAAMAAMVRDPARFADFMTHEPQTNEVRRSACLAPGFLTVAALWGRPLRIFEVGASAGLNQLWDRYFYDFGGAGRWGPAASPVGIDAQWRGAPAALDGPVEVLSRAACDRKPVALDDAAACRRLRSYIWADQFDRLARLNAAIEVARAAGVRVEAEDAVTWTARRAAPQAGAATVLVHSVFWQYLPADRQAALGEAIAGHGAQASADAPFAWLRMEPNPRNLADTELRLTTWPGGEERLLARVHPHGAWIDWSG